MYLRCPPCLNENDRVTAPNIHQIRFQLFLARAYPRRVVALRNPDAVMSKQDGNPLDWHAGQEQLHSKSVSKSVRVSILDFREFE